MESVRENNKMEKKIKISIVIPCYRAEKNITYVVDAIEETMEMHAEYDYEVILVNDGSPDDTFRVIAGLGRERNHIKAVNLSRNFGQHSALMAGYSLVTGEYIVGMDDDGEHDPHEMFKFIDELEKGYDYVCAEFPSDDRSMYKRLGSKFNNWMATKFIGKPENALFSSYYVMRRYVLDEIVKSKNPTPYVGGMLVSITKKLSTVPIELNSRRHGQSSYNLKNSIALWMNGVTAFSVKPLRFASLTGAAFAFVGFVYVIVIILKKLLVPEIQSGYSSIVALLLIFCGMIMITLGVIGEYVGRIYMLINKIPQYVITEIVEKNEE